MNKPLIAFCTVALLGASVSAVAMDEMKDGKMMNKNSMHRGMDMKAMDTNGDGMISKDEFMKAHEAMWDKMKKNSKGMVDMKDMEMMRDERMHDGMAHDGMKDNMKK